MEQAVESQELVKRFLLGQLPGKEYAMVEERIFTDKDYFGELLLVEGELIDDFVFGELSDDEQERMQKHFLVAPERLESLRFTKAIERYVSESLPNESVAHDWENKLREAQRNRDLLELLITEDWLGLKIIAWLRASSKTRQELKACFHENNLDATPVLSLDISSVLSRLIKSGLAERVGDRFFCTRLGIETLQTIEQSFQVQLTPEPNPQSQNGI